MQHCKRPAEEIISRCVEIVLKIDHEIHQYIQYNDINVVFML